MRKTMAALVLSALVLVLSGCVFTKPEASLYRLPKLSGEYESLESQIDALLSSGAEYAAPTSGSNLQSVQMIDLDGDGEEEAVAFFRRANDKKPMKIYIFKAAGDNYERYAVIEGTSNQIYSVNYADWTATAGGRSWSAIRAARTCRACPSIRLVRVRRSRADHGIFPLCKS